MTTDTGTRLRRWLEPGLDLWPELPAERGREYQELLRRFDNLPDDPVQAWTDLPAAVQAVFGGRGWAWNGIYWLDGDILRLFAAAGPPVCASLELGGDRGVGSSGMCFDAIFMNQTLVAARAKDWPGYVSCDSESGLVTVAGIVCPIRDRRGTPVAVWDLDAVEPVQPEDGPFFDRLIATLSVLLAPTTTTFSG